MLTIFIDSVFNLLYKKTDDINSIVKNISIRTVSVGYYG